MPAVSKKQQRFFGMVHAVQKGEMKPPSRRIARVAKTISKQDAKDFAETKRKGLPTRKKAAALLIADFGARRILKRAGWNIPALPDVNAHIAGLQPFMRTANGLTDSIVRPQAQQLQQTQQSQTKQLNKNASFADIFKHSPAIAAGILASRLGYDKELRRLVRYPELVSAGVGGLGGGFTSYLTGGNKSDIINAAILAALTAGTSSGLIHNIENPGE